MAELSLALHRLDVEINPIDMATDITTTFGDCGIASPWLELAHAVQLTSTNKRPVICANFNGGNLAVSIVVPPIK